MIKLGWRKHSPDRMMSSVFRVILPSKVLTVVEIWPQSFSGFLLCRLSFCVLCCRHSCYCWQYSRNTSLHTAKKTRSRPATHNEFNTDGLNCWAVSYLCWWLKTGERAWVVHQSLGSTGRSKHTNQLFQKRAHYSLIWFIKHHWKENMIKIWH